MPIKLVSLLFKPRNIRAFILILVASTLVFAIYQLLLGRASETRPTVFVPLDISNSNNNYRKQSLDGIDRNGDKFKIPNSHQESNIVPRFHQGFGTAAFKYQKEKEKGRCPKIQIFKPDIDVNEIYPSLEFDGEWIRSREYWNPFFEQRYKSNKNSKKLQVFVIPHSHNDPGWLKTFEEYFTLQTRHVLDNAVEKMTEYKNMTFLWSEVVNLAKWWSNAHPRKRNLLIKLVREGRFEIVTGGWIMTDEATVNLYSMIDQLVEGHQWVKKHLGILPKSSWSVDPFGHGSTFPYILKSSSIEGMVIQRIHYGWKKWFMVNQSSDFQWVQRWDYSNKHGIHSHNAPFDIYSIKHSCGPHPQICLNFDFRSTPGEYSENSMIMEPISKQNVREKAELMLEQYGKTASLFKHNIAMISMGDDFRFVNPTEWDQQYINYMKLFQYINSHKERYNADVRFGTLSDYFKAVEASEYKYPKLSGDFHVYSDIFSDGRPAYWSGYYSTRPFWKKFYRETENNLRGAEILFTFANNLANQKNLTESQKILTHSYEDLTIARRWLALFAHHDATTGTSKAATMLDYGDKLFEAFQLSEKVQINAIETILLGKTDIGKILTDRETDGFGELPRQIPITFNNPSGIKKIVLYNSLTRYRWMTVKVVVTTPHVEIVGPSGEHVSSQLNPVLDVSNGTTMILSGDVFELTFLAKLVPLSISIYQVRKSTPNRKHNAVFSVVYCKHCKAEKRIFEINEIQKGDIQLNNDRLQVLFDRSTGMIMSITKINEDVTTNIEMKFGSYGSVYFRSGAYLLMPETQPETPIPFPQEHPKLIIISGPISSEISVFHSPVIVSSKIMHSGDDRMMEGVYMQNQIDLGQFNGEMFMRFDTDLNSVTKTRNNVKSVNENEGKDDSLQPTFFSDQAGAWLEKRVKIPEIKYEGNTYPVNTMACISDESRKIRFSVLVDRSHGFSSMENGRLETLVERRTVYDDSRGMGEGVTDNRLTVSNYILLVEKLGSTGEKVRHAERDYRNMQPTLEAYHHSQELSYPAFMYIMDESLGYNNQVKSSDPEIFHILTEELPCDSFLLNLRTMTDTTFVDPDLNFPGKAALLIVQKLGYLCAPSEKPGCGNPNPMSLFFPSTSFNGLEVNSMTHTNLAGTVDKGKLSNLHDIVSEPFEISSIVINFK